MKTIAIGKKEFTVLTQTEMNDISLELDDLTNELLNAHQSVLEKDTTTALKSITTASVITNTLTKFFNRKS